MNRRKLKIATFIKKIKFNNLIEYLEKRYSPSLTENLSFQEVKEVAVEFDGKSESLYVTPERTIPRFRRKK